MSLFEPRGQAPITGLAKENWTTQVIFEPVGMLLGRFMTPTGPLRVVRLPSPASSASYVIEITKA